MDKPMSNPAASPLYHWAEWPLAILMALLLGAALWCAPGEERSALFKAFNAVGLALGGLSTYLEWRKGALSRSFAGILEGFDKQEPPFVWVHRRLQLKLTWLVLTVLGWWQV
jgi:hypothetical protein